MASVASTGGRGVTTDDAIGTSLRPRRAATTWLTLKTASEPSDPTAPTPSRPVTDRGEGRGSRRLGLSRQFLPVRQDHQAAAQMGEHPRQGERRSRALGDPAMRSRVEGSTDPAQAQPLQQTDPDQAADRSEVDPARRQDGPVPHGPPPVVGVDVRRHDSGGLVEVLPGTGPAQDQHVADPRQDRSGQPINAPVRREPQSSRHVGRLAAVQRVGPVAATCSPRG